MSGRSIASPITRQGRHEPGQEVLAPGNHAETRFLGRPPLASFRRAAAAFAFERRRPPRGPAAAANSL